MGHRHFNFNIRLIHRFFSNRLKHVASFIAYPRSSTNSPYTVSTGRDVSSDYSLMIC